LRLYLLSLPFVVLLRPSNTTMSVSHSYNIKVPQFEGPFDLLLFFIERDEVDIYNIPIFKVTSDFLDYIHTLESLNIEMASEFILFASNLMRIKAKMLLPRKEIDAQGNEIDPRQELIDKILEYKRFKEASEHMRLQEAERMLMFKRGNIMRELVSVGEQMSEGSEIQSVTVTKLFQSYEKVMKRMQARNHKPQHVVVKYNYTMEGQRGYIKEWAGREKKIAFEKIFLACETRIHAIFNFLAILELVQQRFITVLTGEGRNNFILEWCEEQPDLATLPETTFD
jgi:segregation and condensation protein A